MQRKGYLFTNTMSIHNSFNRSLLFLDESTLIFMLLIATLFQYIIYEQT